MMKKTLTLLFSLILFLCLAPDSKAQPAKEGSYSATAIYSGTFKSLAMGKDRIHIDFDLMGVHLSDTGEGLFHNASFRGLGVIHAVNGVYEYSRGVVVFVLPDGDQLFMTYDATGKLGEGSKATGRLVGGTGKLAGIEGGMEWTSYGVRPAAEGTMQGVLPNIKVHWKLP